ncbi:hypothetical protein COT60_03935 [Candidatus Pacearchaeota archaeon CG09_land_8_20_14_0_10_30_9]|nr:MAG: hypothetical protein QJ16_C0018G0009 [archaeon GW2011_AR1]MBS3078329.1 hypothetical protein [Candidatus Pacearchaeota archaeon]OIO39829.1 MAG: hypothetical protein AUJ61_03340 [Candidatus Pacearchaeota archaeon CG1_02_30_18]PIO00778.1 MAG: hypothetical protein COT60_03935 [Candidatus Pacearchaeota archaeon CG09_land_8_20_14_0_10_30_9]PJA71055.1 MAG: hypothetical protein CO153_03595 [Candidatus Pacearchaeota archaeon CG_4_9_14_3_um_filter_30_11]HIH52171.1 hypothetical protein [Nanoarcha
MEKEIGKIPKNDQAEILLRIDDFGGRRGFTIREFVTSEKYTGFTKAGVRILSKDFPKFKEMINSISEEDMTEEEKAGEVEEKPKKKTPKNQEELPDY